MYKSVRISFITLGLILLSGQLACREKAKPIEKETAVDIPEPIAMDSIKEEVAKPQLKSFENIADTTFVRLADYSHDFVYDMRYATENNFLKAKVYDCPECYTRAKTAKALIKVNAEFMEMGYRIKFFDCYRPNSVQHKCGKLFRIHNMLLTRLKGLFTIRVGQ